MPELMPEDNQQLVGWLLQKLKNPDSKGVIPIARELVNLKEGRDSITVGFVKGLAPKTTHILAIALRNTDNGCQLLADNTKLTDFLLKSGNTDIVRLLAGALKKTPTGRARLLNNKPTFVDRNKTISFVEALLKYGNRKEIEAALGEIIEVHNLPKTNNIHEVYKERKEGHDRIDRVIKDIIDNSATPIEESAIPKHLRKTDHYGANKGANRGI